MAVSCSAIGAGRKLVLAVVVLLVISTASVHGQNGSDKKGEERVSNACVWEKPRFGESPSILKTRVELNGQFFYVPTAAVGIGFCRLRGDDGKIDWNSTSGPRLVSCSLVNGNVPPPAIESHEELTYDASGCAVGHMRPTITVGRGLIEDAQLDGPSTSILHPPFLNDVDFDSCGAQPVVFEKRVFIVDVGRKDEKEAVDAKTTIVCLMNTLCDITVKGERAKQSTVLAACNRVKNEESGKYECPRTLKECMDAGPFTVNADFDDDEKMSLKTRAPSTLSVFLSQRLPEIEDPWRVFKTSIAALSVSLTALLGAASLLRRFV